MKHLCVKINESNQNIAYCVNQQREGVKGMFDHSLKDCDDLENLDIHSFIINTIVDRNSDEEIMRLVEESEINKEGFAKQDDRLWLTVGTYDDLVSEVEQEIEYQKNREDD